MNNNDSRQISPIQDLFVDIEKIIDFMELKDVNEADKYETSETAELAEMWMNAKMENDTHITYKMYWDISMFQEVVPNTRWNDFKTWCNNPYTVPLIYHEILRKRGREAFFKNYEEKNDYYRMLNGLPPYVTPESEFIYLTEPMRNQLHATDIPVHLLSPLIQNNYMSTDEYKKVLKDNPDKKYLKYLGLYKIDTYIARKAKDFDIIRYPLNRSNINPNLVQEFASLYASYREYVMTVLYNRNLETLYPGYRGFMGMIIKMFVLMQICNKGTESISSRNYIDDSVLHIMLSMYDISNELLMTNEVRRSLCINMMKLIKEKGTNDVYYDLIDIMGYQDIIVSKLMLAKGQKFDNNNNYQALTESEPYFIQVDLKDPNPYDTITSGKAPIHDYHKIIDEDPTWWDDGDTRKILTESDYSISDSKYIMLEAEIHQMKYMFESVYFARLILDNKYATDVFQVSIPEIFGTETVSIYDMMIYLIAATCMANGLSGKMETDTSKLLATAGFNFDMNLDTFTEFVNTTEYVDKERVMGFMENLTMNDPADINRLFNDVIYPMREWLEYQICNATNRKAYIEYEAIYRALYTYDITKNSITDTFIMPLDIICNEYNISEDDILAYKCFYPHTISGNAVTVDTYESSRYSYPFLSRNNEIDWFIHVIIETPYGEDDRGYVYFYDVLNCNDVRLLTNTDGTRVFMDYNDPDIGWEVNKNAVNKALYMIEHLDENALYNAYFPMDTPVLNSSGKVFKERTDLPISIRSGLYKTILKEKIRMDCDGLAAPATTYIEYLKRKNPKLYGLLTDGNRFELNKNGWINDVMRIVLTLESELNIHMKYFEQSVLGPDLFFKPLITLIKHFKSSLVDISRTGLSYVFGDKIDAGGNSNMFKLFDEISFTIHFVTLAESGFSSQFGLYDAVHRIKHHIEMNDRSELLMMTSNGFDANVREDRMGSIHMVDEMKFFKNGEPLDNGVWYNGEPGTGRWSDEDEIIFKTRKGRSSITYPRIDLDGWKNFVESYNPM